MVTKLRQSALLLGDVVFVYVSLIATVLLGFRGEFSWGIVNQHFLPFSLLYLVWLLLFYIFGLYDLNLIRPRSELLAKVGQCFIACFAVGLAFFYLVPMFGITPKTNLLINIVIFSVLSILWRRLFYTLFSSLYLQNISFLGSGPLADKLAKEIENHPQLGYKFVKFLNKTQPLKTQIKQSKTNIVVVAQNISNKGKLTDELYRCIPLKVVIIDLGRAYEIILQKVPIDFVDQDWILKNLALNLQKA